MGGAVRFESVVPQFTVADVVQTAAYYRDVLGFGVNGYWDGEQVSNEPGRVALFAIVSRDDVQVFFSRGERSAATRTSDGYDAYVRVTAIDALAEELRARHADIVDGPEDRVYGERELVVRDCDGRLIAFGERTSS